MAEVSGYIVEDRHDDPDGARELAAKIDLELSRRSCDRRDPPAWVWRPEPKEREPQRLPRRNQRRRR